MTTQLARARLLQLASQALPLGGYSHSQGLEAAVECGLVSDEASVQRWIGDVLQFSIGTYELPVLTAMSDAWQSRELGVLLELNDEFLATRESAELRCATVQMGFSMRALVNAMPESPSWLRDALGQCIEPSLPYAWSGLATAWSIGRADSATGYLWTWAENQVLAAMKCVPIGQSSGQRILVTIGARIAALTEAAPLDRTAHSNFSPGLAILSSQHETQYSRLFRS